MEVLFGVLLMHSMHGFDFLELNTLDNMDMVNHTLDRTNNSIFDLFDYQKFTANENTSGSAITDSTVTLAPVAYRNATQTRVTGDSPTQRTSALTSLSTAEHIPLLSQPLSSMGSLSLPVKDVTRLCHCNQLKNRCDVNCCCDPDCTKELSLFNSCSVKKVSGNTNLCNQDAAYYVIGETADGFAEIQTFIQRDVYHNILCIQFSTYELGLNHAIEVVPSLGNFDGLFRRFAEFSFSSDWGHGTLSKMDQVTSSEYLYGDVMVTEEENGNKGLLRLPAPSVTTDCLDMNPAAFLRDQTTKCSRSLFIDNDCTSLPALNMQSYTDIHLYSGKNEGAAIVAVEIASITYQSLEGTLSPLQLTSDQSHDPVLLIQGVEPAVCMNVVLQVDYLVLYNEAGEILNLSVALILGNLNAEMMPMNQEFRIKFVQKNAEKVSVQYSGNPGYVLGLALVSGSRTVDGIVQSSDPKGNITLFKGTELEDCLRGPHQRSPVLFGVNMLSGCTLRLEETANCSQLSNGILGVLRGQDYPEYVASFGNSQSQNPMDWVPIENSKSSMEQHICSIPLSFDLEVKWTSYGSLMNPQAQIVSVKEVIPTNTSNLALLFGSSRVIYVTSSVTFIPVEAATLPGYKATPTFDAKLPYDFFFPFV
ncbi:tectonic-1 [Osmerus eperlanus]|uniref:tectonic-1 n=1 Tax=Osmerus eperlanus TaxID=29151 RepID=UPI002E0F4E69